MWSGPVSYVERRRDALEHQLPHLQCVLHLDEGLLSLLEESEDNGATELAIVLIIVHLENLLKGQGIDAVAQVG